MNTGEGKPAAGDAGYLPLSRSQELIWTGQALMPGTAIYNMAWRFDIDADLDPCAFDAAWRTLVSNSDALRSVLEVQHGRSVIRVLPEMKCALEHIDLSSSPDPDTALEAWLAQRARRPFDLHLASHDTALLKVGPSRWVYFLNQHHLLTDALSQILIFNHVSQLYHLARRGALAEARQLPAFSDYLVYEQAQRDTAAFRAAQAHWRSLEAEPGGSMSLYGREPGNPDPRSARVETSLGTRRCRELQRLVQGGGVPALSRAMAYFSVFATTLFALLSRVSADRSPIIGTPTHNRSSLAFRQTIGLFVEMFPLRAKLEEGETFRSLLAKVVREGQDLLRHAHCGVSTAQSVRLFNVVLNYVQVPTPTFAGATVRSRWVHSGVQDPGHALRVQVQDFDASSALVVCFDFNTSLFDEGLRSRVPGHFLSMLDAFLVDPDRVIDEVALAGVDERAPLLGGFNPQLPAAAAPLPGVVELFRRQAACAPQAPCLRSIDSQMTFAELDQRSDRLARELRRRGVGASHIVGVHLTRSTDLVIALLGVLKSGAAYVPLEARLPQRRLAFIVESTGAAVVLTQAALAPRLAGCGSPVLSVDVERLEGQDLPLPAVPGDASAYVIYTSGSTGEPKGVVIDHDALARYVTWAHETFAGGRRASFPLYSSIGFDLTVTSIFVPLISGGEVVIYAEPGTPTDLSVLQVFDDDRVDVVKLTPAHLALVAERKRVLRRIRTLILGGEDLGSELAKRAIEALGGEITVFNEYGPTEAVVGCMSHRFDVTRDTARSVPIGRPAQDVTIYVLDRGLNPVPIGVTGELYIGGHRLARGYLGRDDLSNERFVADPFRAGASMYRSGDLARFRDLDTLEYIGRADDQVKIRGVRVELKEVEQAISSHPDVRAAAVKVIETQRPAAPSTLRFCERCGLASDFPGVRYDAQGVCHLCLGLERYRERAQVYFEPAHRLRTILAQAGNEASGDYDCAMLFSGGKDSAYALYQLAALGPRILALTLDNGFISDAAKANIHRIVEALGVDHRFMSSPAMDAIFVDSLQRHSNVCHGCFKTLYTLATNIALAEGIPVVITGLSRGQFFETRLTPELFENGARTAQEIEVTVLEARKAYHRVDDAVSRLLDVSAFASDEVFERVRFVDFYRYCDVSLEEVYEFLRHHAPWIRPQDTGRSTNCLINDAGIYVHKKREGHHNYALPYSWDVRLGHKTREAALTELNDEIDVLEVHRILDRIGFDARELASAPGERRLAGYFTSSQPLSPSELRDFLAEQLPESIVPTHLVAMESIPLNGNGKVDRDALPDPGASRVPVSAAYRAPRTQTERTLARIWREVLGSGRIGATDNFYELGGDSIAAIRIAARADGVGLRLDAVDVFRHQCVERLAAFADGESATASTPTSAALPKSEAFSLSPLGEDQLELVAELLSKPTASD